MLLDRRPVPVMRRRLCRVRLQPPPKQSAEGSPAVLRGERLHAEALTLVVETELIGHPLRLSLRPSATRLSAPLPTVVAKADVPLLSALVDVRHDRVLSDFRVAARMKTSER